MSAADPRQWVGELNRVRQRTIQVAGWARKLARYVIESPEWAELPDDARAEWIELEDRADNLFSDLQRTT